MIDWLIDLIWITNEIIIDTVDRAERMVYFKNKVLSRNERPGIRVKGGGGEKGYQQFNFRFFS